MLRCGLLGEKLGHSYSPAIHALLGDYEYKLYEVAPDALADFLQNGAWDGLNVTIPYKKAVVPFCTALSPTARALGSVNTLVRRPDGSIFGDNTDFFGFSQMVRASGIRAEGEKAVVLGSGGASVTVCAVLRELGAREVTVISRHGEDNYTNLDRHRDAALVVNTTPVGMYPHNGESPLSLDAFPQCRGVLDIIYNPARTALLLQAEERGIPCASGLRMLVAQAKASAQQFTGIPIPDDRIESILKKMERSLRNIILVGMPGCGKSTVAAALGRELGMEVVEADALIAQQAGMTIPEIFSAEGEAGFRARETAVLAQQGKRSGIILSTGGGCVTREENYFLLHQNGRIFWLTRGLDKLAKEGRPLSLSTPAEALWQQREALYARFADARVDNDGSLDDTLRHIKELIS